LRPDPAWTAYIADVPAHGERGIRAGVDLDGTKTDEPFARWRATNVYQQRQNGYVVVTVTLPLGDIASWQMRRLADLARTYCGDTIRTTVEQNIVLRWVSERDLPELHRALDEIGLGAPGAGTIVDVTACPGTDTCKLGIASSRGLASELSQRLAAKAIDLDEAVRGLHIKISGCFNSCGQHHVSDLGFYGVSRKVGGATVPHFQVVLGGKWEENGGAYGLAIGAVPSKRVPDFVASITEKYVRERGKGESFQQFVARAGKKDLKSLIDGFAKVPAYGDDRTLYSDWRDPREFTIDDMGVGECAGEVVNLIDFDLQAAEAIAFEAQLSLEQGEVQAADDAAYRAMLKAAWALVRTEFYDVSEDPAEIVSEFRRRFHETERFHDKYAGGKFAQYLFHRHEDRSRQYTREAAEHLVAEANLFIEAAHACQGRMAELRANEAKAGTISPPA
jgi:sulfite reductase (ferredoxin)